jgi:hypothetical protein
MSVVQNYNKRILNNMKKIIVITDLGCMLITIALLFYYNYKPSYGLDALESVGKFVLCLVALGIELIILIIVFIIHVIFD